MRSEIADDSCRDIGVLFSKLETVYRRAIEDHNFAAAARASNFRRSSPGLTSDRKPAAGSRPGGRASAAD